MKTMLICTDFSKSATHAAKYACLLANQYKFRSITLLNTYQMIVPPTALAFDSTYAFAGTNTDIDPAKESLEQLTSLKQELSTLAGKDIMFKIRSESFNLGESINAICQEENADLIVMGITGKSKLEKVFIGSNAVTVAQNSKYPVLVIPEKTPLKPIHNVLFACDLSAVTKTTPFDKLEQVLELFKVPLVVLNVDYKNRRFTSDTPQEMYEMHRVFDKYKPRYAFIDNDDVIAGITDYVEENDISLVITVPGNYNFMQQLFHRSKTKHLIYQSPVPLLTLHE